MPPSLPLVFQGQVMLDPAVMAHRVTDWRSSGADTSEATRLRQAEQALDLINGTGTGQPPTRSKSV